MDPTNWSSSSAWYRKGLGLLGCCRMNHTNCMAGSRRCSDAELRLPIK